jgi:nucleoside-diphosphate-sugar epimerase
VVNIGGETPITIDALARRIRALAHSRSPFVHVPFESTYRPGFRDVRLRRPDLSKARRLIGFEPRLGLDETLREVIAYVREHADPSVPG